MFCYVSLLRRGMIEQLPKKINDSLNSCCELKATTTPHFSLVLFDDLRKTFRA